MMESVETLGYVRFYRNSVIVEEWWADLEREEIVMEREAFVLESKQLRTLPVVETVPKLRESWSTRAS